MILQSLLELYPYRDCFNTQEIYEYVWRHRDRLMYITAFFYEDGAINTKRVADAFGHCKIEHGVQRYKRGCYGLVSKQQGVVHNEIPNIGYGMVEENTVIHPVMVEEGYNEMSNTQGWLQNQATVMREQNSMQQAAEQVNPWYNNFQPFTYPTNGWMYQGSMVSNYTRQW